MPSLIEEKKKCIFEYIFFFFYFFSNKIFVQGKIIKRGWWSSVKDVYSV